MRTQGLRKSEKKLAKPIRSRRKVSISSVDLFCGAGGLTHGLETSGVEVVAGVDVDPACQFPYEANNSAKFILKSVGDISGSDLLQRFSPGGLKLLAGCAPCQTFSTYNQKATSKDARWWLLLEFARLTREVKPDFITMENVPGLEEQEVFQKFVRSLRGQGYKTSYRIVDCSEYGIPQQRNRLVLLASRFGKVDLLSPAELKCAQVTVKKAIGHLSSIEAGGSHADDPLHTSSTLSPLNMRRIRQSRPGGTWRDWPEELLTFI